MFGAGNADVSQPGAILGPLIDLRSPDECWPWLGYLCAQGYGRKTFEGRPMSAHRWVWSLFCGPVPAGMVVQQKCENHACCNPYHLRLCTHAEALQQGESTVLTVGDVADIRRKALDGWRVSALAQKYGVAHTTISSITRGKSWRKVRPAREPRMKPAQRATTP